MQKLQIPRGYRHTNVLKKRLEEADSEAWIESGRRRTFRLFLQMSKSVPAYAEFLKGHGLKSSKFKSFTDLKNVPSVDKNNYLRRYKKEDLCWDGGFGKGSWVVSTTSGSTGEPFYFPRQSSQDWQYAVVAEQYLLANFSLHKKKTLYIVGFPMGAWIGGVFTYEAIKTVAAKGYDLSIITPGIHKQEIINAVKRLGGSFDQVIIGSYAPFLRDILEDGKREGINWNQLNVKFIFSAEAFTETFRDYVAEVAGLTSVYLDTLNHYGTVDLGTMAHETPLSILIRRKLVEANRLKDLFPEPHKQPTLCQYNPDLFYFEEKDNNLYCSAYSGIPLFRYDLKDYGGLISYKKMQKKLATIGIDINAELKKEGIAHTKWELPFVYVYERNDFSVSYYAFNVYPDPIRKALQSKHLITQITGKFSLEVSYTSKGQQRLYIHTEKNFGVSTDDKLRKSVQDEVHSKLMVESSEYPEVFRLYGEEAKPVVKLYDYEDMQFFRPGTKQKWVLR